MLKINIIKMLKEIKIVDVNEMYINIVYINVREGLLIQTPPDKRWT